MTEKKVIRIISTKNHVCARTEDAKGYRWGANESGQIGNNSTTNAIIPVLVNDI